MEAKRVRRRGTPIPVPPPRVPTPMPIYENGSVTYSHTSNDRSAPKYPSQNHLTGQIDQREHKDTEMLLMVTPKLDRNGYFNYATSTAKKKKISLMQSRVPRVALPVRKPSPEEKSVEEQRREETSRTRNTVADGRLYMAHKPLPRAPRAPDPWPHHSENGTHWRNANEDDIRMLQNQQKHQKDPRLAYRQQQYAEVPNYQLKGGNSLECYSPKYHHIRPQPKGKESTSSSSPVNYQNKVSFKNFYARSDCLNQNVTNGQLYAYGRNNKWLDEVTVGENVKSGASGVNSGGVGGVGGASGSGGAVANKLQPTAVNQAVHYSETKFSYNVNGQPGNAAQASAAAAFFARASQKLNLNGSPHRRRRSSGGDDDGSGVGVASGPSASFSASLQRAPPAIPPALLRKISAKEATGVGKVKVMLRVASPIAEPPPGVTQFFSLDKRKKQVTLYDPALCEAASSAPEDRKVGVAAPKMFAFDAIFSHEDSQTEIGASALTDVIHAVINGSDGCLFCFGHAGLGKSYTMVGSAATPGGLGAIPCAISWLFRGIAERRARCGTRFSVRASAVELCGHTNQLRDLLAAHVTDTEQSPGVYLRDDPLFGTQLQNQSELRVQTAEKAAFFLDAALANRGPGKEEGRDSHLLYTLHVYQYSVGQKGAVAGGRSRLHLIDLGNSDRGKSSGGIPLSGLGNILLAIFNGQKHLPYRDHNLTHVLKECLGSLTCHVAMIVHVSPNMQNYTDTLTTVQLASRIHRMRRRKIKFNPTLNSGSGGSSGEDIPKAASSSEPDPSSSDLSADTVIYVGHTDDATDGEHPPVYIPNLNSGDNRCSMGKILKGSNAEQKYSKVPTLQRVVEERSPTHKALTPKGSPIKTIIQSSNSVKSSPSHALTPKSSPLRKNPSKHSNVDEGTNKLLQPSSSDEQWIDGPRISKSKVAEARHFMKEVNHVKKRETWVDGPMQAPSVPLQAELLVSHGNESIGYGYMDSHKKSMIRKWVENQTTQIQRKLAQKIDPKTQPTVYKELTQFKTCDDFDSTDKIAPLVKNITKTNIIEESIIRTGLKNVVNPNTISEEEFELDKSTDKAIHCEKQKNMVMNNEQDEDDDSEEMAEIPPALPLIQPLSSREVSMESLDVRLKERLRMNDDVISNHSREIDANGMSKGPIEDDDEILEIIEVEEPLEPVPMQDSCLQVTEEDIAFCMGIRENPLPEVDQGHIVEHPLRILSQENLTVVSTFTDSMSVFSDIERQIHANPYLKKTYNYPSNNDYDNRDYANSQKYLNSFRELESQDKKFSELSKLHELYQSKLAMAGVENSSTFRNMSQQNIMLPQVYSQSLSLSDMLYTGDDFHCNSSIYSEPAYKPQENFCENCKQNISRPGSALDWHELNFSTDNQNFFPEKPLARRFQRYSKLTPEQHMNIAALRHPDGASNPNLREESRINGNSTINCESEPIYDESKKASLHLEVRPLRNDINDVDKNKSSHMLPITTEPLTDRVNQRLMSISSGLSSTKIINKPDGYDSGHDSTPRTSKHSPAAISRRAESGYDSVVRDSESSSIDSFSIRKAHKSHGHGGNRAHTTAKYKQQHDRSFCSWLRNPFTCKNAETDAEISDF